MWEPDRQPSPVAAAANHMRYQRLYDRPPQARQGLTVLADRSTNPLR